jgi:hypothetical protein
LDIAKISRKTPIADFADNCHNQRQYFPLSFFTLHDQTRKLLSLLIFYLLGPILTLGIIGGVVLRKLPSNATKWEYALSVQTGLHWTVGSVEYRSPGFVRLHRVKIIDDTVSKEFFVAGKLDVRYSVTMDRNKFFPGIEVAKMPSNLQLERILDSFTQIFPSPGHPDGFWQISAPYVLIKFDEYAANASAAVVQNTLNKLLSRLTHLSESPIQLTFENIIVASEYSSQKSDEKFDTLRFVQGNLYKTPDEIRSDWTFQIKNVWEVETKSLSFVQSLETDKMEIALRTGKQPILCDFAAVFCPAFKPFSGGTFSGEIILEEQGNPASSRTIRLNQVTFKNFRLEPFAQAYTAPFTVSGTVDNLQLDKAVFGGGLWMAEGHFQIVNGSVDATLFHHFVENFRLTVEPSDILESPRQLIPFTGCAIHFKLQPDGAAFWADERWKNAFMYQNKDADGIGSMVVFFPSENSKRLPVSYHSILSIFAPAAAPVVPLTPGLQKVISVLPTGKPMPKPPTKPIMAKPEPMTTSPYQQLLP